MIVTFNAMSFLQSLRPISLGVLQDPSRPPPPPAASVLRHLSATAPSQTGGLCTLVLPHHT